MRISNLVPIQLFERTGGVSLSYLQSVTRRLVLGIEGTAQVGQAVNSSLAFVGKYSTDDAIFNGNVSMNGNVQLSYFQKVHFEITYSPDG